MDFKKRMSLLGAENHVLRAKNSELSTQCEALRTQSELWRSLSQEKSQMLFELHAKYKALREENSELLAVLDDLRAERDALKATAKEACDALNGKLAVLTEELDEVRESNIYLRIELRQLREVAHV